MRKTNSTLPDIDMDSRFMHRAEWTYPYGGSFVLVDLERDWWYYVTRELEHASVYLNRPLWKRAPSRGVAIVIDKTVLPVIDQFFQYKQATGTSFAELELSEFVIRMTDG